jgi:sugar phosphate isomerase/epimerase
MAFLKRPELIRHVHWSDNYLYDNRGRKDSHLSVGKGTLPKHLHEQIKKLDATILLEHFHGIAELEEELKYIDQL